MYLVQNQPFWRVWDEWKHRLPESPSILCCQEESSRWSLHAMMSVHVFLLVIMEADCRVPSQSCGGRIVSSLSWTPLKENNCTTESTVWILSPVHNEPFLRLPKSIVWWSLWVNTFFVLSNFLKVWYTTRNRYALHSYSTTNFIREHTCATST